LRDKNDNVVIICSIENMDPMGIHNWDYGYKIEWLLSDIHSKNVYDFDDAHIEILGGNVHHVSTEWKKGDRSDQQPVSLLFFLASKATGYPIAIATKLFRIILDELQNQITKSTSALFEPTLIMWLSKSTLELWQIWRSWQNFGTSNEISGWSYGIGRSFQEALHKATQSLEIKKGMV
jgi:carbamoyl-phosphate synthase large subunit